MNINKNALVSMCMPAYNHAEYIQEAIESVINQDYQNIEFIIINDGSIDNTHNKIKELENKCINRFVNFIYISRENEGVSNTVIEALSLANGKYIMFTGSDDTQSVSRVSTFINHMNNNPTLNCCYSAYNNINTKGIVEKINISKKKSFNFKDIIFGQYDISLISYIYNTKILKELNAFSKDVKMEDWHLALKMTDKFGNIEFIDDTLYNHRIHDYNTHKEDNGMQTERFYILKKYETHPDYEKAYLHWNLIFHRVNDKNIKLQFYDFLSSRVNKYQDSKILIYGNGTFGQMIYSILHNNVIGFIDKNTDNIDTNYDKIIISVLGREEQIINYLENKFNINKSDIITL